MGSLFLAVLSTSCLVSSSPEKPEASYLYPPSFQRKAEGEGPVALYCPQPGDIFLATDQAWWARMGHFVAGGGGVHHSGIMFRAADGHIALLEAGPFNSIIVEKLDPLQHLRNHVQAGDRVWIRRRCRPLTSEESAHLTAFAEGQVGKRFAVWRLMAQVTLLRSRGPVRTCFVGKPHGDRQSYFCSELVTECCIAAGLIDPATARPPATYPRDVFYGTSCNPYLNAHLEFNCHWQPPARWTECLE